MRKGEYFPHQNIHEVEKQFIQPVEAQIVLIINTLWQDIYSY
jgi:hypothetical protein